MSFDLYLRSRPCDHCGRSDNSDIHFNFSYNLSPMWAAASGDDIIIPVDGKTGKESQAQLEKTLEELLNNPDKYKSMNPPNGWGSYNGLVNGLVEMIKAVKENPYHIWRASR